MRPLIFALLTVLAIGAGWLASALANPVSQERIEVELVSEQSSIQPGGTTRLGLRLLPDPNWHTYWVNPGDSGLPIDLDWSLPAGSGVEDIDWPYPQRIEVGHLVNYGYEGEHLLPVRITWPEDLSVGESIDVGLETDWLVCKIECIPGQAQLSLRLPVSDTSGSVVSEWADLFAWADGRQPQRVVESARFKIEADQLSVQLPTQGLALSSPLGPENIFVKNDNVVDHAQPFFVAQSDQSSQLALPLSPYFNGQLDSLGVVVVDGQSGEAFEWSGQPGELVTTDPLSQSPKSYFWVILSALIGGVLLNLMPCVFPVLSIKALHLVQTPSAAHRTHALAYTAGVVAAFSALATALLALRAGGQAIGWGFQLQSPWVVGALIYVFFVMGLSLSGAVAFGNRLMGLGQSAVSSSTHLGSFMTGVLASIVASPCTAPFMGAALGAAVLMPWWGGLGVFLMLGFGLALPLLVLGFFPKLARWLPKPGPWMETFKQLMAFPLYLAAVWLVWVLARQTDAMAVAYVLVGLVALAFVLWLAKLPERHPTLTNIRHVVVALGLVLAIVMLASAARSTVDGEQPDDGLSEPFSQARLDRAVDDPTTAVFVNMTADWCVTCLVNEQVALSSERFTQTLKDHNVLYLKGDWTRRDETITNYLARFERNGVPLYVAYPRNGDPPIVLPQVLTPEGVSRVLESL